MEVKPRVGPPIASPPLVKPMMYIPTFQLLGEISADVLLKIMTYESSVVLDDYMSLDSIRGASIPLNGPGFFRLFTQRTPGNFEVQSDNPIQG